MSDAVTDYLELASHLRNGQQCDEDGIMCIVSRQACHEAADTLEAIATQPQDQRIAELEAWKREASDKLVQVGYAFGTATEERDQTLAHAEQLREALEVIAGGDGDAQEIAQQTLDQTPPQVPSKRDGEVLALREAAESVIAYDLHGRLIAAKDGEGDRTQNVIFAGEVEELDRLYDVMLAATQKALTSSTQAAQDAEERIEQRTLASADTFQNRVAPWMQECFGPKISADITERNHRFLEEALELVQSTGCTESEAHQLVDYVFNRDIGDVNQEIGGVMVTLAALCLAAGINMHQGGETELKRIWGKIEQIRTKQAAKPDHSPLPGSLSSKGEG